MVASGAAQDLSGERLTLSFSDPSRPGLLKINILNGGISVKGYSGKEVIIETRSRNRNRRPSVDIGGLRRIDINSNLSIEQENNVMTVMTGSRPDNGDLEIQVPTRTNLNLKTLNGGNINVEGIEGDIDVTNTNGNVTLVNSGGGSVVAHSENGRVTASLRELIPNKSLSFSSMNGNLDITLPANVKANLRIRSDNGDTWTAFDNLQVRPSNPTSVQDPNNRGRYRIQTDRTTNVTINGGGPELDLRTLNGNIYIRKGN